MMLKKLYITPEIKVYDIEIQQLMLVASGEKGEVGTGTGNADDNTPDLVVRRRGTWGNLWN